MVIALRSPVTVMPVLAGFVPGVTITVSVAVPPGATVGGVALPVPVGGVGERMVTVVCAVPDRDGVLLSVMVAVSVFNPPLTPGGMVPLNVKVLLPAAVKPGVPRLIAARLPVTLMPVLSGFVPGVTFTVSVTESPTLSEPGFADTVPLGGVDGVGAMPRTEMLSIASAWAFVVVEPLQTE